MTSEQRSQGPVQTADEAVRIAMSALKSVYGSTWSYDVLASAQKGTEWIVDIKVVLFGTRRITISSYNGQIAKIESITSAS